MTRAIPAREIRSRSSYSIFTPGVRVLGLPLRVFDKLAATVATFVILFAPTSHAIFHHIVRTTSGTNQIGFHDETPQNTGPRVIILHPLHKSTTHLFYPLINLTQNKGFSRFNLVAFWKRKYKCKQEDEPWYLLTNLPDF
jgi:hypothetical protein